MYIEKAKETEIPKGAIRLTSDEVVEYMTNLIQKWPSTTEIWSLKLGNPILASAVVISSTLLLKFYRDKLKLKNYGRLTLFIPVVILPSIFNQLHQNSKTTRSIILQDECPVCITTQSMLVQLATGILYPLMGAVGGSYMFAIKTGTIVLKSNGREIVKEFAISAMKTSTPLLNRLTVFVIGHVLLSYAITHYQMENIKFMRLKMLEQQEQDIKILQQSRQISNVTK